MPGTQNVLAFYTPTFDLAQKLNEELKLTDWNFPILLLVGSVIERDGIVKHFTYRIIETRLKNYKT